MPRKGDARPTDFEMRILKVLWEHGPSTARTVLEHLEDRSGERMGYTTVLKMLQLMEQKDMVDVDRSERSHVYGARLRRQPTLKRVVKDFVDRTFDGARPELLVHLVRDGRLSRDELDRLEQEIAELRAREKKNGRR